MRQIFELDFAVSRIDGSVSRDESNMFGRKKFVDSEK